MDDGAPGVMRQYAFEPLGEDLTWALWGIAEPASAVNSQPHRIATPGQVERAPKVTAVRALTEFVHTSGTARRGA
jgi:hypothetical protein